MEKITDCHQDCSITKTLRIIGSKRTMLILHNLFEGKKRFGELQKALPGISPKTLSDRLNELENEKIINKTIFQEIPLHVEYELSKKGQSLDGVFKTMAEWGEKS